MSGEHYNEPVPNGPGVWYLLERWECPVCGRGDDFRTRMPPPAPPREDRYRYEPHYDYCLERR